MKGSDNKAGIRLPKPNILVRLLALLVTAALALGALTWWSTGTSSTWTR